MTISMVFFPQQRNKAQIVNVLSDNKNMICFSLRLSEDFRSILLADTKSYWKLLVNRSTKWYIIDDQQNLQNWSEKHLHSFWMRRLYLSFTKMHFSIIFPKVCYFPFFSIFSLFLTTVSMKYLFFRQDRDLNEI